MQNGMRRPAESVVPSEVHYPKDMKRWGKPTGEVADIAMALLARAVS